MSHHTVDDLRDDEDWKDSATSSLDPTQREQIKMFCSVTGADSDSALHVLEAHSWDMDRSVMFFMEGGVPASAPQQSRTASTTAAPARVQQIAEDPINVDDDMPALEAQRPAQATGTAPPSQHEVRKFLKIVRRLLLQHLTFVNKMMFAVAVGNG